MTRSISAARVASLVGAFDRSPAYAGLATSLQRLIGEGRISLDTRLPSERDLTEALAVSRTTVTRAYAHLRDTGFAEARQGAGTFTRVPGGRRRALDNALLPYAGDDEAIDLNCAASAAPPGLAAIYREAADDLCAQLGGHGYYPAGLPELQAAIAATYDARGLPTRPEQILVTPGALSAAAIVAQAFTRPRDRVLVEEPVYPNATLALRNAGARLVPAPVDPGHDARDASNGWDLDGIGALLHSERPRLAYLIPDFQNPTGHLMSADQRDTYAAHLRAAGTVAVVDEAHVALPLDGQEMPPPFASFAPRTISIGSASKAYWGGLRLGWIRADADQIVALTRARISIDLGAPVLEQLALIRLLTGDGAVHTALRSQLVEQRDRLTTEMASRLPEWRFRTPGGGLALWCELPAPVATTLVAEAERRGVILAGGPIFSVEGGLGRFVRIPWTRPADVLTTAVERLADAWAEVAGPSLAGPSLAGASLAGDSPRPRIHVA